MPLVRALALIAAIFWFSPVREDGRDVLAPEGGRTETPALDRQALADLLGAGREDAREIDALWHALPEEARAALTRRVGDALVEPPPR